MLNKKLLISTMHTIIERVAASNSASFNEFNRFNKTNQRHMKSCGVVCDLRYHKNEANRYWLICMLMILP